MKKRKGLEKFTDEISCYLLLMLYWTIFIRTTYWEFHVNSVFLITFIIGYICIAKSVIKFTDWNFNPKNYKININKYRN